MVTSVIAPDPSALTGIITEILAEHLEMYAAAYLKETNIPASEAELVQEMDGLKIRWYFQKRERGS